MRINDLNLQIIQKQRCLELYRSDKFEQDMNEIVSVYDSLGGKNNHLSIPLKVFDDLDPIELFGSPLNTQYEYCSPFAIERNFGSLGNFFGKVKLPGDRNYIANPPFDEKIMDKTVEKIKNMLIEISDINVLLILPAWDNFSAIEKIKELNSSVFSRYLSDKLKFYNHYSDSYVFCTKFSIIHLSNHPAPFKIDPYIEKWSKL